MLLSEHVATRKKVHFSNAQPVRVQRTLPEEGRKWQRGVQTWLCNLHAHTHRHTQRTHCHCCFSYSPTLPSWLLVFQGASQVLQENGSQVCFSEGDWMDTRFHTPPWDRCSPRHPVNVCACVCVVVISRFVPHRSQGGSDTSKPLTAKDTRHSTSCERGPSSSHVQLYVCLINYQSALSSNPLQSNPLMWLINVCM